MAKSKKQEPLHIGNMIKQHIAKNRLSKASWSRAAGVNYQTVIKYTQQSEMRVSTLYKICIDLKHNFLREIADTLPAELPPQPTTNQTAEVAQLQHQIAELTLQVKTLRDALALIGGKQA